MGFYPVFPENSGGHLRLEAASLPRAKCDDEEEEEDDDDDGDDDPLEAL